MYLVSIAYAPPAALGATESLVFCAPNTLAHEPSNALPCEVLTPSGMDSAKLKAPATRKNSQIFPMAFVIWGMTTALSAADKRL